MKKGSFFLKKGMKIMLGVIVFLVIFGYVFVFVVRKLVVGIIVMGIEFFYVSDLFELGKICNSNVVMVYV